MDSNLKKPDGFVLGLRRAFGNLASQSHTVFLVLGALFLLGLGSAFWMNHREANQAASRNALFLAEKALSKDLKGLESGSQKKEDLAFLNLDVSTSFKPSIQELEELTKKYAGTRAAGDAALKLGDLFFSHGNYEKALDYFKRAAESSSGFDRASSLVSVGYCLENLGKSAEALEAFEKSLRMGEASLKPDILLSIARIHGTSKNIDKARSTYDQILKEFPNTEYSKSAELFKASL